MLFNILISIIIFFTLLFFPYNLTSSHIFFFKIIFLTLYYWILQSTSLELIYVDILIKIYLFLFILF
jgi:hypothetical protein